MKHTLLATLTLMVVLMTGCTLATVGSGLGSYPSASWPEGATVRVRLARASYDGQLLETRADAILILSSTRSETRSGNTVQVPETVVRLVPFDRIESVQFQRGSTFEGRRWLPDDAESRERFRLLSRFPQGLTPELLQQVLKMYGQTTPAGGKP